ncbi:MAG TPA: acyl-CoA dehydratase activase [Vicinamibacterales bacterium]|nr:acyl-CoA dehydratase activase [Vicinamibacterales bacterium]
MSIHVGIDVGSASVKAAAFSSDAADAPFFEQQASSGLFDSVRALPEAAGRRSWLAVAPATPITGNPARQAQALLDRVCGLVPAGARGLVMATGSGSELLPAVGQRQEFQALCRATELLLPTVRTLFEIGGETSKYIRFEPHDGGGALRLGIADYQTNGDCAAGTGAFLDQQAGRLRFRVEEIGEVVLASPRAAQIAGRCSVFAKSDMIHAQQKGFSPEEILRGLCDAVARNFRSAVTKSRRIDPDVAFVGGVARNRGVVRALEQAFSWAEGTLIVPDGHQSFGAIGAAVLAHDAAEAVDERPVEVRGAAATDDALPGSPPLSMENVLLLREHMKAVPREEIHLPLDAYLGIDIGSVSTNLVVLDAERRVLKEIYLRTNARPIEAVATGLRQIEEDLGSLIHIRGVGTTGSGRELIGELVGADTVNDEITAHKTGAAFIDDTMLGLGVDTIFEIGGQDAKFISLDQGVVVDFAMNEACAAGTGSFLEERARELGVRIEGQFAETALSSESPVRLGERCTVFMERDVQRCLLRGAALDRVVAGLAYSVATNYINRVVRGRKIGDVIFFQGGTAYNDAVAAAFSGILGKRIIVPPFNGVMGALGSALLAREKAMRKATPTTFRGFAVDKIDYKVKEFTCHHCTNSCQMQRFVIEGEATYWGDKCSERYRKAVKVEHEPVIENLIEFRRERVLAGYDPTKGSGPVIGIPFTMSTYDWAPFWFAAFGELDLRVLLSEPTTNQTVALGLDAVISEPCFPIQVAHGHVRWLLDNGADLVFVPNNISAPGDPRAKPSFFCPWNQTLPFVVRQAPHIYEHRDRILAPTLWFNQGVREVARALGESLAAAGIRRRGRELERAVTAGFAAHAAFRRDLIEAGTRALDVLDREEEHAVLLLGRPYNMYDKGVSLDIATKLRKYYGVNVIGLDFLDLDETPGVNYPETMFWNYGGKILAAAAFARSRPRLHIVYITNFKCGPDSYIKQYVGEASGRPFLSLQFDGHNNDAGMLTRCEAYLDSKGVLRRWDVREPRAIAS